MESVAMTDHGTLSGPLSFTKESKEKGYIKCRLSVLKTYCGVTQHTDKDPRKTSNGPPYLLAMNHKGYQNLMHFRLPPIGRVSTTTARRPTIARGSTNEGLNRAERLHGGEIGNNNPR